MASSRDKIAIVGMACRFPGGAHTPEKFWDLLLETKNTMEDIPPSRFNLEIYLSDQSGGPNKMPARKGHFLQDGKLFDEAFFNISPREAMNTDPQHRLLLETVVDALDDAGYKEPGEGGEFGWNKAMMGVFIGSATDSYQNNLASQPIDAFFCPGTIRAFAGGRISHYLGWQGPCIVYDTACSSSLVAVHSACQSLVLHECDAAVAGAANMLTSPEMYSGLSKGYFISSTGDCRTFDESADGYCRAEGVGVVVLKRLEDALRDKDKIDAVIIASGVNQSGPSESLTTPHSETQAALFISNCKRAGISPLAIRVVEAHGTGTRAGDYAEMEAIKTAYCTNRKVGQYSELFVGSLKANVGHSESAAGMASLIKGALMAKHRQIPAHIGITTQTNSRLGDLEACGIRIPSTQQPLKPVTGEKNIYTAIHNFGAHGGNAAVIIQEPPIAQTNPTATNALMSDPRSSHVVVLSAKSHTNFSLIVERLLARIRSTVPISLPDLSYTTTARRMDYPSRIALSVSSIEELERQLLSGPLPSAIQGKDSAPRIGFLIGGNGSQYKGMGKILYQSSPVFQAHIDDCNAAAEAAGVHNLIGLINGAVDPRSNDLTSALAVTVGIFSVGYAAGMMWKAWGIEPHLLLGHSLGEYVALALSGCISIQDSMKLLVAKLRSTHSDPTGSLSGGMLAIGVPAQNVEEMILDSGCSGIAISCINGTSQTVVGGAHSELMKLHVYLKNVAEPPLMKFLPGSIAWHTPSLARAAGVFEHDTALIQFRKAEVPILLNTDGSLLEKGSIPVSTYLSKQMVSTVRFDLCATHPFAQDIDIWIELSAKAILTPLLRPFISTKSQLLATLNGPTVDCWGSITKSLARLYEAHAPIKWAKYHDPYPVKIVTLPSYPFTRNEHWIAYSHRPSSSSVLPEKSDHPQAAVKSTRSTSHNHTVQTPVWFNVQQQHEVNTSAVMNPSTHDSVTRILSQELNVPEYGIKLTDLVEDVGVDSIMWHLLRDRICLGNNEVCHKWPKWRKGTTVQDLCDLARIYGTL